MENDLVLGFCLGSSGLRFWPSAGLRPSAYACRPRAKTSDPSYLGKNLALGRSIADHSSRWTVPTGVTLGVVSLHFVLSLRTAVLSGSLAVYRLLLVTR